MAERFPFGPGKHGPNATVCGVVRCYRTLSNEIQNHWLICILRRFFAAPPLIDCAAMPHN